MCPIHSQSWVWSSLGQETGGSSPEGHPLGNLDPNPTLILITGPFSPLYLLGPSNLCLCLNLALSRGSSPARPRRPLLPSLVCTDYTGPRRASSKGGN